MTDEATDPLPKVCNMPFVAQHCDWNSCIPAIEAAMFWSKIKYHVIGNSSWIPKDLKFLIIGHARHVEYSLLNGLKMYCMRCNNPNQTFGYDDFCMYALSCILTPQNMKTL